jgi:hypothetical protein
LKAGGCKQGEAGSIIPPATKPPSEPLFPQPVKLSRRLPMDTTTLLIIIVILFVLGGGYYGRGRWY